MMVQAVLLYQLLTLGVFSVTLAGLRIVAGDDCSWPIGIMLAIGAALGWPLGVGVLLVLAALAAVVFVVYVVAMLPVWVVAAARGSVRAPEGPS